MSGPFYVGGTRLPAVGLGGLGLPGGWDVHPAISGGVFSVIDPATGPLVFCASASLAHRISNALNAEGAALLLRDLRRAEVLKALDASPWFGAHPKTRAAIADAIITAITVDEDE